LGGRLLHLGVCSLATERSVRGSEIERQVKTERNKRATKPSAASEPIKGRPQQASKPGHVDVREWGIFSLFLCTKGNFKTKSNGSIREEETF
jgi:hypothetical protein